jgi:hypothetical protein
MNTVSSRLKAIAVTALAFAIGAFVMLGIVWLSAAFVPDALGGRDFDAYSPHASIGALTDLRAISALSATFLVLMALVLLIDSAYCDRMMSVLADVLLMAMAAIAGFVAGYWVLLRLSGYNNFLDMGFIQATIICPIVVFVASLLPISRIRASMPLRMVLTVALLAGGPLLLVLTD